MAHNRYQIAGGEDAVVAAEVELLRQGGHEVVLHEANNDGIQGLVSRLGTAFSGTYSARAKAEIKRALDCHHPDVVHVHNFFPRFSPSIYDACAEARTAVVQTMHNYRTICPGALLMRDGNVCELCVTGSPYQSVKYGCYRDSKLGTLAVARMVATHRRRRTWSTKIQRVIALTEFAKGRFQEAGFDVARIAVKPNFIADPVADERVGAHDGDALFVGRISPEKGVPTMIDAWRDLDLPLKIAGDGPLLGELSAGDVPAGVSFLGRQTKAEIFAAMNKARFLVMPSLWYEGFPMVIVEAFAHGLPVICSRLGGMAEVVRDGVSGLHFNPGDSADLAAKVQTLIDDPARAAQLGAAARQQFLRHYGPEQNLRSLEKIYDEARHEVR